MTRPGILVRVVSILFLVLESPSPGRVLPAGDAENVF